MTKHTLFSFYLFSFLFVALFLCATCMRRYKQKSFLQTSLKLSNYLQMQREYSSVKIVFDKDEFDSDKTSNTLYAYYKDKQIALFQDENSDTNLIAFGNYTKSRFTNGWDVFRSETYSTASPIMQCYAVGIIEGILSQQEIYSYMSNFDCFLSNKDKKSLKNFFELIDDKIRTKIGANENEIKENSYNITQLSYMACIHAQLIGEFEGYKLIAPENDTKDLYDLYLLNAGGNYDYTLEYLKMNNEFSFINSEDDFFKDENLKLFYNVSKIEEIWKKLTMKSHCSAIVKLTKNNIFLGHNTWTGFNELLRTYKKISFVFEGENQIIGMKPFYMQFSSYPGLLFSSDEYYIIRNNLAIVQTSLNVLNGYIYKNLIDVEKYIPEFMRLMIVNMLSSTGKQWKENYYLINKNNHLYQASFIVIDYNNINSTSDLMYIVEDIPGSVKYTDYTEQLREKGYYGSFNLPFFKKDHGKKCGLFQFKDIDFYGDISYNPRQYICDNLAPKVKNMKDFKNLLTYNRYKMKSDLEDDPSVDNPNGGIAVRTGNSGTVDYKIIDKNLILEESSLIYSGPIYRENDTSGAFMPYKVNDDETCRMGYPEVFDFEAFYFE